MRKRERERADENGEITERIYREARIKLDAAQLAERLNGTGIKDEIETTTTTNTELAEDEGEGEERNMESLFGDLLETPQSSEDTKQEEEVPNTNTNTNITILDLSLPKHFSGKTPKTLLSETVHKLDKYATISYRLISSSRAFRSAVQIRWYGGRIEEYLMEDESIGVGDEGQANNYVATKGLFGVNNGGTTMGVNKLLNGGFRDLWEELERERKEREEEEYRELVKGFKKLAEERGRDDLPVKVRPLVDSWVTREGSHRLMGRASQDPKAILTKATHPITNGNGLESVSEKEKEEVLKVPELSQQASEKLKEDLMIRQQWPAYQEMLVRPFLYLAQVRVREWQKLTERRTE